MAKATKAFSRSGEPERYVCQNCGTTFEYRRSFNAFYCSSGCAYEKNKCPGGCGEIVDMCRCEDRWGDD